MKSGIRFNSMLAILFATLLGLGSIVKLVAQEPVSRELVSPINGKLMLVGAGELSAGVGATFALLADEEDGTLIILSDKDRGENLTHWQEQIGKVTVLDLDNSRSSLSSAELAALRSATAIWLEGDFSQHQCSFQMKDELKSVLSRGGIVGGQGLAAESLGTIVGDNNGVHDGFNLLPNSYILATEDGKKRFRETLKLHPGRVGWEIPPSGSVVVHGRQISVISYPEITLRVEANGDWPERVDSFGPPIDHLPYTSDLISWNRSGIERLGDLFPPPVAPVTVVPKGALLIIGGGGSTEDMWEKMIEYAGGKDAFYVCISQTEESVGAEKLRERGCENIAVHVISNEFGGVGYGNDVSLLEDLEKADALYFGGGRTFRLMDAYHNTRAHYLMHKLLDRGGLIVGTSAGAQIVGDFLVRGDPRTNDNLWMEGNDVGLNFLSGVIIDAHFRQRGRHNTLPALLVKHPQMLGIGLDEATALFIKGTTAEVLGKHSVSFYDLAGDSSSTAVENPVILESGEKYDLKRRKALK